MSRGEGATPFEHMSNPNLNPEEKPPNPEADLNAQKELPPKFYEHATLLVLFYDRWFRFAAIMFVLALISLGLLLPKLWRVTPEHMPIVRISGLDFLESGALRRSAEKQSQNGQVKEALVSWHSAVENNPGNTELLREMLQFLNGMPQVPPEFAGYAANRALWLLGLSKTNLTDLALVTETLEKIEEDAFVSNLAASKARLLPVSALGAVARANFRLGRMSEFDSMWQINPDALSKQSDTALYRMAWEAGWGPPSSLSHGRLQMQQELNSTNQLTAYTAHHLELLVNLNAQDLVNYRRNLDWLVEHHEDRVIEHINLWKLLISLGNRAEATRLAKSFSRPAANAEETVGIASVYNLLEMPDVAIEFLDKQSATYGYSTEVWILLAELRMKEKRWDELFGQGITMRRDEHLGGSLDGYSYFIEGIANARTGRNEAASKAFKSAVEARFAQQTYLAFDCARRMREAGYSAEAENLLRKLQKGFSKQAEYWFELSLSAYHSRDMETFSMATEKAYQLEPDKDGYVMNYAAVLIAERRNPEESVKLTNRQLNAFPNKPDLQVNHALALLQVQRFDEAERLLKAINPLRLNAEESSVVNYAWAEFFLLKNDGQKARKAYALVNTNHLMPPQIVWFETKLKAL